MQKNQASLQQDLHARRTASALGIKQEPVDHGEDEPMDTSSSLPNGSVNGYPSATPPSLSHANGDEGSHADTSAQELQDFVLKTFRKHFVVTLSEFKRLLNLHLASMPVGRSVFHSISDHMLTDAIVLSHCKQIMVPVSIQGECLLREVALNPHRMFPSRWNKMTRGLNFCLLELRSNKPGTDDMGLTTNHF